MNKDLQIFLLFIILGFAVFYNCLSGGFIVVDDNYYVTSNYYTATGLSLENINWAFTHFYFGNWSPVTWISHMLDCQLFGQNPFYHHLVSLLIHIASCFIFYKCLIFISKKNSLSLFSAIIFLVHPFHLEPIAWAACRKDVLSGLFFFCSIYSYLTNSKKVYSMLFFILGLMTKSAIFYLPLILILIDFWQNNSFNLKESIKNKLSYMLVSIPFLLLGVYGQRTLTKPIESSFLGIENKISNATYYLIQYIYLFFNPSKLSILYAHPLESISINQAIIYFALLLFFAITSILLIKKYPFLFFGLFWFLISTSPYLQFSQMGNQPMADRWMHIPIAGISVCITWLVFEIIKNNIINHSVLVALIVFFSFSSFNRAKIWAKPHKIFEAAAEIEPNNDRAWDTLACSYEAAGDRNKAHEIFKKSLETNSYQQRSYERLSLMNRSGSVDAKNILLDSLLKNYNQKKRSTPENIAFSEMLYQTSFDKAVREQFKATTNKEILDLALELLESEKKNFPKFDRIYFTISKIFYEKHEYELSLKEAEELIKMNPYYIGIHNVLGSIYLQNGNVEEALNNFEKSLEIEPNNPLTRVNLANQLIKKREFEKAFAQLNAAIVIWEELNNKLNITPYLSLSNLFLELKKYSKAESYLKKALEIEPNNLKALNELGKIYYLGQNNEQAIKIMERLLAINPDDQGAKKNLENLKSIANKS